eukprot:4623115-Alexandrium_andersonii.AAC.1
MLQNAGPGISCRVCEPLPHSCRQRSLPPHVHCDSSQPGSSGMGVGARLDRMGTPIGRAGTGARERARSAILLG